MNIRFPIVPVLLITSALALFLGCSGSDNEPLQIIVSNSSGSQINQGEALVFSATGLASGEFPVMVEALTDTGDAASKVRLTADKSGAIDNVILAYDVGFWSSSGDGLLAPGHYTVRLTSSEGIVETDITIPDTPTGPIVWGCDIDGNLSNSFLEGQPVFVAAEALQAGVTYRAWPVKDRRSWSDGDIIKSWQQDNPGIVWPLDIPEYIEVTADGEGKVEPTQLLAYATLLIPGVTDQFDIVLDAAPYAIFNAGTDAVDGRLPTGAVVQKPNDGDPIYAELASYSDFTYSNHFHAGDTVNIWLNPAVLLEVTSRYVLKYILLHTTDWQDGMSLEDITGGIELDPVQIGCVNEGLILAWLAAEEGEYDVLLDINGNGIYDEGIDVLDGGPHGPGFVVEPLH